MSEWCSRLIIYITSDFRKNFERFNTSGFPEKRDDKRGLFDIMWADDMSAFF